jgi:hypothetical protein
MDGYIKGGMTKYGRGLVVVDPYYRDGTIVAGHIRNPSLSKPGSRFVARGGRLTRFDAGQIREISTYQRKVSKAIREKYPSAVYPKKHKATFGNKKELEELDDYDAEQRQYIARKENERLLRNTLRAKERKAGKVAAPRAPNSGPAAKRAKRAKRADVDISDEAVRKLMDETANVRRGALRSANKGLKQSGKRVKPDVRAVQSDRRSTRANKVYWGADYRKRKIGTRLLNRSIIRDDE